MRHKIQIQEKTQVSDGMGGFTETWATVNEVWAAIWPVSAKESRENMRVEANITHNIRIRYRTGIVHAMRVLFGSRTFEIKGLINPDERNIWLDMVCNEQF